MARRKLSRHHLDPYQHAAFRCGIVRYNTGEEERDPTLELAMEYTGALGTIVFDESCRLRNLTEAQIGRNQYATDVELERLDGEADHAAERIGALEDRLADMERSLNALLELGWEQTECHRHGRLCDYRSTLSFYFAKSNSFPTLVDLILPSYLIYSRDLYLILPIHLHIRSHTFIIFPSNTLVYYL